MMLEHLKLPHHVRATCDV